MGCIYDFMNCVVSNPPSRSSVLLTRNEKFFCLLSVVSSFLGGSGAFSPWLYVWTGDSSTCNGVC